MPERDGIACDPAALDATEQRFWRELWRAAPPALAAEHGIDLASFGPAQATIVRDLAPVRAMNLVLGAAEADEAQLGAALDWVRNAGVDCYVALTAGLPHSGKAEALRRMVRAGVDVNAPSADLYPHGTPLHHAVSSGRLEAVKALVEAGATRTAKDSAWGGTPLGWAEHFGHTRVAKLLLKARRVGAGL